MAEYAEEEFENADARDAEDQIAAAVHGSKTGLTQRLIDQKQTIIWNQSQRIAELEAERRSTAEALKFLRSRVVGFLASNNVFRVIDEEIKKFDQNYVVPDCAKKRHKLVVDRNIELENTKASLKDAVELINQNQRTIGRWMNPNSSFGKDLNDQWNNNAFYLSQHPELQNAFLERVKKA